MRWDWLVIETPGASGCRKEVLPLARVNALITLVSMSPRRQRRVHTVANPVLATQLQPAGQAVSNL
jgi:hypothetical protein